MSEAHKGKTVTEKQRQALLLGGKSNRGKKRPHSEKTKELMRQRALQNRENRSKEGKKSQLVHPVDMKMERNPAWKGGISFEPYPRAFNKELKQEIRKRDRFRCQECFRHQDELGYQLPVHHIDFDKTNNDQHNLISLCRSCHIQTQFGRENWIEYYQEKVIKNS